MGFFTIVITVLTLMYGYIGLRLIWPSRFSRRTKALLWAGLALFSALPFIALIFRHELGRGGALPTLAYLSLGYFVLVFTLVLLRDLALLAAAGARKIRALVHRLRTRETGPAAPADPGRRLFLAHSLNTGILSGAGVLAGYGAYEARRTPDVARVEVPIANLHPDLEGIRIAQITDTHVGASLRRAHMEAVVAQVNALAPDIVALTGDLADGSVPALKRDVAPLADLAAPHGLFFVTGNHEYYSGVLPWLEEVDRLGFAVLLNEHQAIERGSGRLLVAGVTDYRGGRFHVGHTSSPQTALKGAPSSHAKVLLAHQPRSIYAAARAGFDLQISGHTHGGQFYPWRFFVGLHQPYVSGLHRHERTWIYVSRGTGYWGPPLRLGAPAEITLITLTAAPSDRGSA